MGRVVRLWVGLCGLLGGGPYFFLKQNDVGNGFGGIVKNSNVKKLYF